MGIGVGLRIENVRAATDMLFEELNNDLNGALVSGFKYTTVFDIVKKTNLYFYMFDANHGDLNKLCPLHEEHFDDFDVLIEIAKYFKLEKKGL